VIYVLNSPPTSFNLQVKWVGFQFSPRLKNITFFFQFNLIQTHNESYRP